MQDLKVVFTNELDTSVFNEHFYLTLLNAIKKLSDKE